MNEAEHQAFLDHCEASGLSGSDLFRLKCCLQNPSRIRRHRRLDEKALARILGQLGRWGNNLNQIAHALNIAVQQHPLIVAGTLTRRREPYHQVGEASRPKEEGEEAPGDREETPSIHELEEGLAFTELPPVDPDDRALFLERVLPGEASEEEYASGSYPILTSWARTPFQVVSVEGPEGGAQAEVSLLAEGPVALEKRYRFSREGKVEVRLRWDPAPFPPDAFLTTELSLAAEARVEAEPEATLWRFPIATFSKSERGFDETVQGESVLIRWPVERGEATVRIRPR